MGNFIKGRIRCLNLTQRSQILGVSADDDELLLRSIGSMLTSRSQPSWPSHLVIMNLARVLFKKQHPEQQQHGEYHDGRSSNVDRSPAHSATTGVQVPADEAAETSPTTRSPRRKTRSSTKHSVQCSADVLLPNPLHSTVVFKAIRSSPHRRFAQVLPNLFLGTLRSYFFTINSHDH